MPSLAPIFALKTKCRNQGIKSMAYETALQIDEELQRTMYLAAELVGMLRRVQNDIRQSCRIRKEIHAVAQHIEFLIQEHKYSTVGTAEQKPDLIKFGGRPLCNSCRARAIQSRRDTNPAETRAIPPPIWQRSFEFAFACTGVVASEFFGLDCAAYPLDKLPNCLLTLRSALWRLQQLLPPTGKGETKIQQENLSGSCAECGQALEVCS